MKFRWGYKNGAFRVGLIFLEETPEKGLFLSSSCKDTARRWPSAGQEESSLEFDHSGPWYQILLQNWEKINFGHVSHLLHGILKWHPPQTNTAFKILLLLLGIWESPSTGSVPPGLYPTSLAQSEASFSGTLSLTHKMNLDSPVVCSQCPMNSRVVLLPFNLQIPQGSC